jgi:hypothetical protein
MSAFGGKADIAGSCSCTNEARRIAANIATLNRLRQNFSRPRLFVASHGYHHGDHEPGNQDSEHNIIEGCHAITAKKKAAR